MALITATAENYDRLSQFATIPGKMGSPNTVDNGDGTVSFPVDDEVAERMVSITGNDDLDAAFVEFLDMMALGHNPTRAH